MFFNQLFGDGKTQSGSWLLSCNGTIQLGKHFENRFLLIKRNTNPGVFHPYPDHIVLLLSPNFNISLLGGLHAVAQQVEENLFQLILISSGS